MKLSSLQLENYRCFTEFKLTFDKQLTVLVGINGSGKTAVLDAVAVFLKHYAENYCHYPDISSMPETDIHFDKDMANLVFTAENFQKNINENIPLKISFTAKKIMGNPIAEIKYIDEANKHVFDIVKDENHQRIIVCYYSAKRFVENIKKNTSASNKLIDAYSNAFSAKIDFSATLSWFIEKSVQEALKRDRTKQPYNIPEVTAVKDALVTALKDYNEPYVDNTPLELFVTHKKAPNVPISLVQLSDGYRTMLALVMDLARRMAVANDNEKCSDAQNVLHRPGIVLIDEVELHLHPAWQQTLLPTLMQIFPLVQFIVTTHSPQVVSSVETKHIRILGNDDKVYNAPQGTWGAEASRILKQVFGVDNRPPSKARDDLDEYRNLVYNDKWDTQRALQLRDLLDERYGDQEPELVELDIHIENRNWEKGEKGSLYEKNK